MAYGTPYQESDIRGYYTNIRHGQEPPKPLMDQLVHERLGGLLPMADVGVVPPDVGLLVGGAVSHEEDCCRFSHQQLLSVKMECSMSGRY